MTVASATKLALAGGVCVRLNCDAPVTHVHLRRELRRENDLAS
jgi:hypothetical protein